MTYVHITRSSDTTLDDYNQISGLFDKSQVSGWISHAAGMHEGSLVVVDLWESKQHADDFETQVLFPAFAEGGAAGDVANTEIIAFDAASTYASA